MSIILHRHWLMLATININQCRIPLFILLLKLLQKRNNLLIQDYSTYLISLRPLLLRCNLYSITSIMFYGKYTLWRTKMHRSLFWTTRIMSHFAGSRRKISVAREKFRHAGPRLRNGSHFSALDLNVVYMTGVKPPHAFVPRTDRDEPWRTRRFSPTPRALFPADFIYRTYDSNDEGINRPCLWRVCEKERK